MVSRNLGLVAEEVAKMNSDLDVRDETGEVYTVCYEAVNAMLLNEFLKELSAVGRSWLAIRFSLTKRSECRLIVER
jgi:hypothetical protein